jgi:glucosamine-6-phosphate deaminase
VQLLPATRASNRSWFGGDPERVPTEALSMGMATILQARAAVLMATGAGKARVVDQMLRGPIATELPASFLQLHPDVTVMVDEAASPR